MPQHTPEPTAPAASAEAVPADQAAAASPETYTPTERTTVKRHPERATYDRGLVASVLDEALICHIGFCVDGRPYVIPTLHARQDATLFLHGSPASRMLRNLKRGIDVCVTATIVDGVVFARSAFHHSLNYRSVMIVGTAEEVRDPVAKLAAMDVLVEHVAAGRSKEARRPNDFELRSTMVLRLSLEEVSAKVRTGPPIDDNTDLELPVWAGVLPLHTVPGEPIPDPFLGSVEPTGVVTTWQRPT